MAKAKLKLVEDAFVKEMSALGNSKRTYAHVSADLLNEAIKGRGQKIEDVAAGCELHRSTIERMMREGGSDSYAPMSRTNENIHRYFNMTPNFSYEYVKPRYQNKPKNPD